MAQFQFQPGPDPLPRLEARTAIRVRHTTSLAGRLPLELRTPPRGNDMRSTIPAPARFCAFALSCVILSGCVAGAVVGAGAAVVGGTAKATGAVIGAGVDAVTTSDEEERAKRERAQREHEREQRRCERRQRQGKDC